MPPATTDISSSVANGHSETSSGEPMNCCWGAVQHREGGAGERQCGADAEADCGQRGTHVAGDADEEQRVGRGGQVEQRLCEQQQEHAAGHAIAAQPGQVAEPERTVQREQQDVRCNLAGDGGPRRAAQPVGQGAIADLAPQAAGHRKCQHQRQYRREDQWQQEQLVAACRVVEDV
ncbi:hypothetical protein G6F57_018922 [Rhizopus arrhizus]|nr:hypothetical protein G6F57_018922 [Rhizopus arrhizus]